MLIYTLIAAAIIALSTAEAPRYWHDQLGNKLISDQWSIHIMPRWTHNMTGKYKDAMMLTVYQQNFGLSFPDHNGEEWAAGLTPYRCDRYDADRTRRIKHTLVAYEMPGSLDILPGDTCSAHDEDIDGLFIIHSDAKKTNTWNVAQQCQIFSQKMSAAAATNSALPGAGEREPLPDAGCRCDAPHGVSCWMRRADKVADRQGSKDGGYDGKGIY